MALMCECEHIKHEGSQHHEKALAQTKVVTTFGTFLLCTDCSEQCYGPKDLQRVLVIPPNPKTVRIEFEVRRIEDRGQEEWPTCQWCQDEYADLEYWIRQPDDEEPRKILEICHDCHEGMANQQ
jgi:hypothetical protein